MNQLQTVQNNPVNPAVMLGAEKKGTLSDLVLINHSTSDYQSDEELAVKVKHASRSVNQARHRLSTSGHTFGFITEILDNGSVKRSYRYLGATGKGFVCEDEIKPGIKTEELEKIIERANGEKAKQVLTEVIQLNEAGYWTYAQLAKRLKLTKNTAQKYWNAVCYSYPLEVHFRGARDSREIRVIGLKEKTKAQKVVEKKQISYSLINQIFC